MSLLLIFLFTSSTDFIAITIWCVCVCVSFIMCLPMIALGQRFSIGGNIISQGTLAITEGIFGCHTGDHGYHGSGG